MYHIVCYFEKLGLEFSDATEMYSPNTVTQYENEYKYIRASLFSLSLSMRLMKLNHGFGVLSFQFYMQGRLKGNAPQKDGPKQINSHSYYGKKLYCVNQNNITNNTIVCILNEEVKWKVL